MTKRQALPLEMANVFTAGEWDSMSEESKSAAIEFWAAAGQILDDLTGKVAR